MLGITPIAATPVAAVLDEIIDDDVVGLGRFTLTGMNVGLFAARKLYVESAAYTLTGIDISFILSLSSSSFNRIQLVGSTATRIRGFKMIPNFVMTAGDTKTLVVSVKTANGEAVSISGATIKWQCAKSHGKTAAITKTTDDSSIVITNGPNGIFTITLDPDDTEDLKGNYFHEAEVTFQDGTISTVLVGTMKINPALIEAT